jgi:RimJ/RimL family protein N-acetyltransferase
LQPNAWQRMGIFVRWVGSETTYSMSTLLNGGASGGLTHLRLIRPGLADITFIMATERTPGYEYVLGRSEEGWHRAALGDPRFAYLVGMVEGAPVGFAIICDWGALEGDAHIKRFAVARPGEGFGKPLIRAVVDAVFNETRSFRLSLGLFPENVRARRLYESAGFRLEGVSRGSALFNGVHRDELVMAILRPDWAQARAAAS